jgi:hypothetical protein
MSRPRIWATWPTLTRLVACDGVGDEVRTTIETIAPTSAIVQESTPTASVSEPEEPTTISELVYDRNRTASRLVCRGRLG